MIGLLEAVNLDNLVVLNPRRDSFDLNDGMSETQIRWERDNLQRSDITLFWFSSGPSVQPITLYELGKYTVRNKPGLMVGCDPDYSRKFDVEFQCKLEGIPVNNSLESMVDRIVEFCRMPKHYHLSMARLSKSGILDLK